jgi:hypothetical protein
MVAEEKEEESRRKKKNTIIMISTNHSEPGSSVSIANDYGLESSGIDSR